MKKIYTEQDALSSVGKSLFVVENALSQNKMKLQDIKEMIPCFLHLNNAKTIALEYIDPEVSKFFPVSEEKVLKNGMSALQGMCHPGDLEKNIAAILSFLSNADPSNVMSFFERLRTRNVGKNEFDLHFTVTKLFGEKQCIALTFPVNNINNIADKISTVLDEHEFLKKNFERFASLTKQEKRILRLLARGHNNPEISEELFISRRTVENHRKNINRKLGLKNFAHLIQFTNAFNLV
ncbi:response regulator transcription factor [Fulvivirga sp. M361]|uniref:response regulator transcription factor n=1 Tax=Fulvivirga sp. M361 TaxID=2594266 RepID=UPI0016298980|nr:helix-turn-helix transcriptional regulator [Fulvivirga sp. M361]